MPQTDNESYRAKVRMYRQGFGDCFLLTLPRRNGEPFYMLIDCGMSYTCGARRKNILDEVIEDIRAQTGNKLDVLVLTHEHRDHLLGFLDERIVNLDVGEVWMSWVEDATDSVTKEIVRLYGKVDQGLAQVEAKLRLADCDVSADRLLGVQEAFGARSGTSNAQAMQNLRDMAKRTDKDPYKKPGQDPIEYENLDARFFILGPPREIPLLTDYDPDAGEGYALGARQALLDFYLSGIMDGSQGAPFDEQYRIPVEAARQLPFFRQRYWGNELNSNARDPALDWRRIDGAWLEYSLGLAAKRSDMVNNTSLVIAVELKGGDVLLFPGDAQAGNCLSWPEVTWTLGDETVTGEDLLRRTISYKLSHHGSKNATMKEKGLELMESLQYALLTVAPKKDSDQMCHGLPHPKLTKRLNTLTDGKLIRTDEDIPPNAGNAVREGPDELYYELTLS